MPYVHTRQLKAFYSSDGECERIKDKNIQEDNENAYNLKNYLEKFKDGLIFDLKKSINATNNFKYNLNKNLL